jgi:exodeoxyribonuclease VIII
MHIMLDLETMGTAPDAPIIAIGACRFDQGGIVDSFYQTASLTSAVKGGARMDTETVLWWLGESDAAREQITDASGDIEAALQGFATWVGPEDTIEGLWGNGAAFDNAILRETYRRHGMAAPWNYSIDRCYRTVKARSNLKIKRVGTHHNALDDATSQAQHLIAICRQIEMVQISSEPPNFAQQSSYGNVPATEIIKQIEKLRQLIRKEGSPAIQNAWDEFEPRVDFLFQRSAGN